MTTRPLILTTLACAVAACGGSERRRPVEPRDQPPVITSLADTTVAVGDTLRLRVRAVDPEGGDVFYRLVVPWMPGTGIAEATLDSLSGAFEFVPKPSDQPARWFGFFVRDAARNESSEEMYVRVTL
jgi:hypothetical protein